MQFSAVVLFVCLPLAGTVVAEEPPSIPPPSGRSIGEFLTPDGPFDLEAARRSGYEGPLDIGGFQSAIDPATGEPAFHPAAPASPADDPDDIYWDNSISPSIPGVNGQVYAATVYNGAQIGRASCRERV